MATNRTLTPEQILAIPNSEPFINLGQSKSRDSVHGIKFNTMVFEVDGKYVYGKITVPLTPIATGPWAESKFPSRSFQIDTKNNTGKSLEKIIKLFETYHKEDKLNVKRRRPNLNIPYWNGTDEKPTDNPKVKINIAFGTDSLYKYGIVKYDLVNNEIVEKNVHCDLHNCHNVFKYGTFFAGVILVTYNTHPSRGLTLTFELQDVVIKQAPRVQATRVIGLTREQKLAMVDDTPEDTPDNVVDKKTNVTVEDQLKELELSDN